MASVDVASLDGWHTKRVVESPERRETQKEHLRAIQQLDERIRRRYTMTPVRSAVVRANTFSSVAFRDDQVALTLYRAALVE